MEGTLPNDAGAQVRSGAKVLNQFGACPENDDLYGLQTMNTPPSAKAMKDAMLYKGGAYHSLLTLYDMKCCLADEHPHTFVDGIDVYASFETDAVATSGNVPMPAPGEQYLGGHCTLTFGYDDNHLNVDGSRGAIKKRNSWGAWGEAGDFWLPYAYVQQYLTDATILHLGPAWK
jgi:C1A family cysteine protease